MRLRTWFGIMAAALPIALVGTLDVAACEGCTTGTVVPRSTDCDNPTYPDFVEDWNGGNADACCNEGQCLTTVSCSDDSQCSFGQSCVNGKCADLLPTCFEDADCSFGQSCSATCFVNTQCDTEDNGGCSGDPDVYYEVAPGRDKCVETYPVCPDEWTCGRGCGVTGTCSYFDTGLKKCSDSAGLGGSCDLDCGSQNIFRKVCLCSGSGFGTCTEISNQNLGCGNSF